MSPSYPYLLAILLGLFVCATKTVKSLPRGLEIKSLKLCGPHDKTAKIKIYPWPFLPSGKPFNFTVAFTPAEDIFAVTAEYEVLSVPDGRTLSRGREDVCHQEEFENLCTIPSGENFVWRYADTMRAFPPGFKMTIRAIGRLYNEDHDEFFCADAVATIH